MYLPRILQATLKDIQRHYPVLLVTGPRQVGKTTLLQKMSSKGRLYVTLDVWENRQLAASDPKLFLEQYPPPVIIDEVQYAPQLFPYIKLSVDQKKKSSLFWLSGSQQFPLMKNLSESLAGRVAILKLLGLSLAEIEKMKLSHTRCWSPLNKPSPPLASATLKKLSYHIFRGGFPKLYSTRESIREDIYFSSYLQTYLERDVRDLTQIGDLRDFERFIRICAARTGQLLNLTDMARDVGIAPNTAKKWLSILQASFQIYLLEPYYHNITKRMTKMPKLYFLDTGLLAHLTGWKTPETIVSGAMGGAFFETYVISQILKSYWGRGCEAPIWYWRSKEKEEIDLVFEIDGELYPVEIKLTATPTSSHIATLQKFISQTKANKGFLICLAEKRFPLTKSIEMVPWSEIT